MIAKFSVSFEKNLPATQSITVSLKRSPCPVVVTISGPPQVTRLDFEASGHFSLGDGFLMNAGLRDAGDSSGADTGFCCGFFGFNIGAVIGHSDALRKIVLLSSSGSFPSEL